MAHTYKIKGGNQIPTNTNANTNATANVSSMSSNPSIIFYSIFAGLSMLCLIITRFLSGVPAYGLQVTGYGLLFFAMVSLGVYIFYSKHLTKYMIFGIVFYMLTILVGIGFKLYSLLVYKDRIMSNEEYYSFLNLPIFLLTALQIAIISTNFIKDKIPGNVIAIICFLGVVTLIATTTHFYVLKYFHADGFCSGCHR